MTGTEFFQNNYVHAYLTCEDTENVSMGVGGAKSSNNTILNTHIYKYNTINEEYMNEEIDTYTEEQYVEGDTLREENTYRNEFGWSTYFDYASLQNDQYPIPIGTTDQGGVDLPIDPEITELNSLSVGDEIGDNDTNRVAPQSIATLPSATVYPVSINEINIDFSSVPEGVSFTYYVNEEEKETVELIQKTYTFKYNYQDTLEIKLTNGQDENVVTITPDDVRSNASLVDSDYVYLAGTSLYINEELQSGEYVNVYNGYALNSNGQVLEIATKQIVATNKDTAENQGIASTQEISTTLEQAKIPLHTYNYNGNTIETYGTYSTVNDNVKQQIYNVRSGKLSALSNTMDMKIGNYIVDNYNSKEYQTILNSAGELIDLKEMLQYPDNFLSRNIKQIVQNTDVEKTEMMVLYNTGKVIVFNYVTGDVVYENDEKADSGLADYLVGSISSIWSDYEEKQAEYVKSKELEAKLAELPIEVALQKNEKNNVNNLKANNNESESVNNNYITVYNEKTDEYDVYSEDEILNSKDENPISETEKIKENGLESVYDYEIGEEIRPQINGAIIVVAIIGITVISLIVLRKIVTRNNTKK